jgi:hypothetical protein
MQIRNPLREGIAAVAPQPVPSDTRSSGPFPGDLLPLCLRPSWGLAMKTEFLKLACGVAIALKHGFCLGCLLQGYFGGPDMVQLARYVREVNVMCRIPS